MVARQSAFISEEHFKLHMEYLSESLIKFEAKIKSPNSSKHKHSLLESYIGKKLDILMSGYCTGKDLDWIYKQGIELNNSVLEFSSFNGEIIPNFAPDNILEQYIKCTWILSFAYFFNAAKSDVEKIIQHIPYTGKDKLIDRLIAAIIPEHPVSQEIAFPDVYKPLCDAMAVYDKDARDLLVQLFLTKYYPSLKKHDVTWYDSHKEKDPEYNFHTGYWVFELAAIAVAIGWDDSDFRDNLYYPKDLADWKREQLKQL